MTPFSFPHVYTQVHTHICGHAHTHTDMLTHAVARTLTCPHTQSLLTPHTLKYTLTCACTHTHPSHSDTYTKAGQPIAPPKAPGPQKEMGDSYPVMWWHLPQHIPGSGLQLASLPSTLGGWENPPALRTKPPPAARWVFIWAGQGQDFPILCMSVECVHVNVWNCVLSDRQCPCLSEALSQAGEMGLKKEANPIPSYCLSEVLEDSTGDGMVSTWRQLL